MLDNPRPAVQRRTLASSRIDAAAERKNPRLSTGALVLETAVGRLADLFRDFGSSNTTSVDLIDLCSTNSNLPFTPGQLRELAVPGAGTPAEIIFEPYGLDRRLGPERRAEIARRYEAGDTAQTLADEFEVSKTALLGLLRRQSVVVRRRALTEQQINDLARQYTAGKTIASLEVEAGIPHGTIQRALNQAGVTMRPRGFRQGS